MNAGIRNPALQVRICLALLAASVTALVAGILAMRSAGAESAASGIAIAFGIIGTVIFSLMLGNFIWATRIFAAIKRGQNVIARWTVPADVFDRYRANEAAHVAAGYPNGYKLPRKTPPEGVEVLFATDGMIIGDTYHGLATTGLAHVRQVGIIPGDPPCIGFQTALTTGRATSSGGPTLQTTLGVLRSPVPSSSGQQANAVLDHYSGALAGQIIVKPDFWKKRIRWGLRGGLVFAVIAGAGFALEALEAGLGIVPLIMAVSGVIFALGGLILAFLAWTFSVRQRRGRHRDGTPA